MVQAINSNTGSEYDLKEDFNPYSDRLSSEWPTRLSEVQAKKD